ncbi:MAG TPA: cytochrome c [Candidatus Binataceae bacterium]|nr:cytochrome c [Candidatus Binataceae bacterium]
MRSMQNWISSLLGLLLLAGTAASGRAADVALGRQIYLERCASCHGLSGEGDGPVAPALITPPANLRRLSERFGNPLPENQVARFIDGRAEVKAHGPRDMPVWGARFYAETRDESAAQARIAELVAYLQSIQTGARHAHRQQPRVEGGYARQ